MSGRPLLFYSYWGLGFHNQEAERKALAFREAGYDVVYVPGVGIRNPRLTRPAKMRAVLTGKLRRTDGAVTAWAGGLRTASLAVVPPRQLEPVRRLNTAWVRRQLEPSLYPWSRAVAWLRFPTPEVVDALATLRPAAVIYECVDAWRHVPDFTGPWVERLERTEDRLLAMAQTVVVPSEALAELYRRRGGHVEVVPHGTDLFEWPEDAGEHAPPITVGFLGTLDFRLDLPVLRAIATENPDWRLRLIGPVRDGFDPEALANLPNVSVEPPVPHATVGAEMARFDLGIMPYFDHPCYHHSCPVKNLEYLAAGLPAVARPIPALDSFSEIVYFARTPEEFVSELRRALAEDSPERARRRRKVAKQHTWAHRIDDLLAILDEALAIPSGARA